MSQWRAGGDRERWEALWKAARPDAACGGAGAERLGEYAVLLRQSGQKAASGAFPETAAHLATGCARCIEDLESMLELLEAEEREQAPRGDP
jgi:hypothetical protein